MVKKVATAALAGTALVVVAQSDGVAVEANAPAPNNPPPLTVVASTDQVPQTQNQKTLYVKVTTTDLANKAVIIGERIVDMYHFGTRNWLHNHFWWAMHNGHLVETEVATADQIDEYLLEQKKKLAEKFNGTTGA
jgi:hypothetical protein